MICNDSYIYKCEDSCAAQNNNLINHNIEYFKDSKENYKYIDNSINIKSIEIKKNYEEKSNKKYTINEKLANNKMTKRKLSTTLNTTNEYELNASDCNKKLNKNRKTKKIDTNCQLLITDTMPSTKSNKKPQKIIESTSPILKVKPYNQLSPSYKKRKLCPSTDETCEIIYGKISEDYNKPLKKVPPIELETKQDESIKISSNIMEIEKKSSNNIICEEIDKNITKNIYNNVYRKEDIYRKEDTKLKLADIGYITKFIKYFTC